MFTGGFFSKSAPAVLSRISTRASTIASEKAKRKRPTHNYVYNLNIQDIHGNKKKGVHFYTVGCQGNGKTAQEQVAELMARIAADPSTRPDFILFLGDNVYDNGVSLSNSPDFQKLFHEMYADLAKLGIPCFVIQGNHDQNLHRLNKINKEARGISRGQSQTQHSYETEIVKIILDDKDTTADVELNSEQKEQIYENDTFTIKPDEAFPFWNMPHRYYSLIADDTQIFCLDSNNLVREYLEYITDQSGNNNNSLSEDNQIAWFFAEVEKAKKAGRKIIIAQHHPLEVTEKRAYHGDANIYLEPAEIEKAKDVLHDFLPRRAQEKNITPPYSDLVRAIFEKRDHELKGNVSDKNEVEEFQEDIISKSFTTSLRSSQITLTPKKTGKQESDDSDSDEDIVSLLGQAEWQLSRRNLANNNNNNTEQKTAPNDFQFDAILCAHVHGACYFNNEQDPKVQYKIHQMIAGGGGGKLQKRKYFGSQHNIGIYRDYHGFVEVICRPLQKAIEFIMHFTDSTKDLDTSIKFTSDSAKPIVTEEFSAKFADIQSLYEVVQSAINKYFEFIHSEQERTQGNYSEKDSGIRHVHELWAYISRNKMEDYEKILKGIYVLIYRDRFSAPDENSFISIFDREHNNKFNGSFLDRFTPRMRRELFIQDLIAYQEMLALKDMEKKPQENPNSLFSITYKAFDTLKKKADKLRQVDHKTKESTVGKLCILIVKELNNEKIEQSDFLSQAEMVAMRNGRLGTTVEFYEKLGVLPQVIQQLEASQENQPIGISQHGL